MAQGSDLNEKIVQLFRYAQVGKCVNSVSRDVNNLLGVILAYAELVSVDPNLTPDSRRMVMEIVNAVRKASVLVSTINDVARKERRDIRVVPAVQLAEQALSLVQYSIRTSGVNIDTDFGERRSLLAVDMPKLIMALVYLLLNAFEAAQNDDEKRIRFSVVETSDKVEYVVWNSGSPPDGGVADNMFKPFFSTKGDNHLGLGLFFAREIAGEHDGSLEYVPDQGFVMALPFHNRFLDGANKGT